MSNLRKKYAKKVTKLKDLQEKNEQDDANLGYSGSNDYLDITDGKTNKFRLFPAHDGPDFFKLRKRYWVTVNGDDGDAKRTVLDARVHGGQKRDIIDEYVKFAKKNVKDNDVLSKITHWKDGLTAEHSWIAYAVKVSKKEREFGLLSFKKTVRDAINKAIFIESDDEPIEVDPFTHPDDGLPLLVKYNSKPNKKKGEDYYDVQIGRKAVRLTDEELEKHDAAKSLDELFDNVYTLKDFELALDALEKFDIDHEVDLFEDDRWLELVQEIREALGDSEEDEDEDEKPKKKSKKKSKKKVEEDDLDEDEEEDDDDFEDEDEDEEEEDDDDFEDEDEDEDEEDEDEDEEPKKKSKKKSKDKKGKKSKMSVDDIRARLRKKK